MLRVKLVPRAQLEYRFRRRVACNLDTRQHVHHAVVLRDPVDQAPRRLDQQKVAVQLPKKAVGVEDGAELGNMGLADGAVGVDCPLGGEGFERQPGGEDLVGGGLLSSGHGVGEGLCQRGSGCIARHRAGRKVRPEGQQR